MSKQYENMKSVDTIGCPCRKSGCNHILAKYFQGYLYWQHTEMRYMNAQEINTQYLRITF
jgi:hypothetical protein